MSSIALPINYSFDYNHFSQQGLEQKAQQTLSDFLGFINQTFDRLLENGQRLCNFYNECLVSCPNGKKVFDAWLNSDFGASRYIARAAMAIFTWFDKLPQRIQRFIHKNVQKWSVSSLRQLTKVSTDLVEELVSSGKKTAAQVQEALRNSKSKTQNSVVNCQVAPLLEPGMRVVVVRDDVGWTGCSGTVKELFSAQDNSWWVILDHIASQGSKMLKLFKASCLQLEAEYLEQQRQDNLKNENAKQQRQSKKTYTSEEVENLIASERKKWEEEKKEEEIGKQVELENSAQQAVEDRLKGMSSHISGLEQKKQELTNRVVELEGELERINGLAVENERLKQQNAYLEHSLAQARESSWKKNTFTAQAEKILNINVAACAEKLSNALSKKEVELAHVQAKLSNTQQVLQQKEEEIKQLRKLTQPHSASELLNSSQQEVDEIDPLISQLGEILSEKFRIYNWSRQGYRSIKGQRYQGTESIRVFCKEANQVLELTTF